MNLAPHPTPPAIRPASGPSMLTGAALRIYAAVLEAMQQAEDGAVAHDDYTALMDAIREEADTRFNNAVDNAPEDDDRMCGDCNGSGEGHFDGSSCSSCHGSGDDAKGRS